MPRMLDMIRNSQVPFNVMHSAAHGSLSVPPAETLEILVYLAVHHKLFGEQARMTLAGWDEKASLAAASDPATIPEVLEYLVFPDNLRPVLLPALAENPAVREEWLYVLAESGSRKVVEVLLKSERVMSSTRLALALQANPSLRPSEHSRIGMAFAGSEAHPTAAVHETEVADEVVESVVTKYLDENASELAAEKDKPFHLIGMSPEELSRELAALPASVDGSVVDTGAVAKETEKPAAKVVKVPAAVAHAKHLVPGHEERRESALQKISKLDIKGRIALAMRGSKEDRSILVRDSTKLVALAVLDSPKVSEKEVESFALQKNVLESVLRTIPLRRKFAKNYNIIRNLVYNPRTPIDASLGLMKGLLVRDLKNLSENKDVADTIRKVALRLYTQKMEQKR